MLAKPFLASFVIRTLTWVIFFSRRNKCTKEKIHFAHLWKCMMLRECIIVSYLITTWFLKVERNFWSHMPAQDVTRYLLKVVIWRNINGSTLERNHLPAQYVKRYLLTVILWRHMEGPTLERSYLPAQNVSNLPKLEMWQYIKGPKLERSHLPTKHH